MTESTALRHLAACGVAWFLCVLQGCGGSASVPGASGEQAATNGLNASEASSAPGSVGEVSSSGEFPDEFAGAGGATPAVGASLQIVNETRLAARVTVVFSLSNVQTHVAFLRVPALTSSSVESPSKADRAFVSGTLDDGTPLSTQQVALKGTEGSSASGMYLIEADPASDGASSEADENIVPPTLSILEPSEPVSAQIGSALRIRWEDDSGAAEASIIYYLRKPGSEERADWLQISPSVSSRLDGINDEMDVVLQSPMIGDFELIGEIATAAQTTRALARGRISLFRDPGNLAPSIVLLSPERPVEIGESDLLMVRWDDSDDGSAASVFLSLFGVLDSGETLTYPLAGPLPADPDGVLNDEVAVSMRGVLPGTYDLVAVITDGQLSAVSRLEHHVHVSSTGHNVPPTLALLEPAGDVEVSLEGNLALAWEDEDPDSSAIISFMLDPDLAADALDGDEILLAASIAEDVDGPGGDDIRLGLPPGVRPGKYALAASITDGVAQSLVFGHGHVLVVDRGQHEELPEVDVVWPLTDQYVLPGASFSFGVVFHNITNAELLDRYVLKAELANDEYRSDLLPISSEHINGTSRVWIVDGSHLNIPSELGDHRFDIEVSLYEGERLISSDFATGATWIRREFRFDGLEVFGVDCSSLHATEDARVDVSWTGGGWDSANPQISPLIRFFVAKDGLWPPPLPDDRTHRLVAIMQERVGESAVLSIPWMDIRDMDPGTYVVVAITDDPFLGEIEHRFIERPFEICRIGGQGGGQRP